MTTKAECAADMMALVTRARLKDEPLLDLALDVLKIREGETVRELIVREAQLVSILAGFSAALIEALDSMAPGRVDPLLQGLALKWATEEEQ